jgi:hypothetical protein
MDPKVLGVYAHSIIIQRSLVLNLGFGTNAEIVESGTHLDNQGVLFVVKVESMP